MTNLFSSYTNGLNDFVEEMTSILHEGALPLYRSRRRYPVDQTSLYLMALEATAFYDRYLGYVPTTEQVSRVLPEEGSYQKVQAAYQAYRQEDPKMALTTYCQRLNSIIDSVALTKADSRYVLTPDYRSFSQRIEGYLQGKRVTKPINL
jgi:hypothetical protein